MKSRMLFAALMLCSAVLPVGTFQSSGCEPDGQVKFICGVVSPEDLVAVPRSNWVIASSLRGRVTGRGVHLINAGDYTTTHVFPAATPRERPDKKAYASCPGPIDPAEKEKFGAHGLAVRPGQGGVHTVYLVHHGFRESIEVFEIDTQPKVPTFTWVGCVVAPGTARLNSVVAVPGGGFATTASTPAATQGGPSTAGVREWNPKDGWTIVPGSESRGEGQNGIELSPDGKWFYVSLHRVRKVMRLSRGQTPVRKDVVDVSFQPDNVRWQADGSLLVAGQGGSNFERVMECLREDTVCPDATNNVARIDPQTLKVQQIITYPANERFRFSTVALQVGREIWMGSVSGDRIARYPIQ